MKQRRAPQRRSKQQMQVQERAVKIVSEKNKESIKSLKQMIGDIISKRSIRQEEEEKKNLKMNELVTKTALLEQLSALDNKYLKKVTKPIELSTYSDFTATDTWQDIYEDMLLGSSCVLSFPAGEAVKLSKVYTSITHGPAGYIIVGTNCAKISTDGSTWTDLSGFPSGTWKSVDCKDSTYVAVGEKCIAISEDGTTWEKTVIDATLRKVAHSAEMFVAVGSKTIMTSTDAKTWSSLDDITTDLYDITYTGTEFIITGTSVMYIYDGTTITKTEEFLTGVWKHVACGDGSILITGTDKYIFISESSDYNVGVLTSTDAFPFYLDGSFYILSSAGSQVLDTDTAVVSSIEDVLARITALETTMKSNECVMNALIEVVKELSES